MPNLTIEVAWTCMSNFFFETVVVGSNEARYLVSWGPLFAADRDSEYGWSCECKGFKYRGTCRHIDDAKTKRCGWNGTLEPTLEASKRDGEPCCPKCGLDVQAVRVGV